MHYQLVLGLIVHHTAIETKPTIFPATAKSEAKTPLSTSSQTTARMLPRSFTLENWLCRILLLENFNLMIEIAHFTYCPSIHHQHFMLDMQWRLVHLRIQFQLAARAVEQVL